MSIIVHVNRFILQKNREEKRSDPAYCIHGPEEDGYPFLGHYYEIRGEGSFYFTPGKDVPIPEPDTPPGATHVMVLGEGCTLYGDDGERWLRLGVGMDVRAARTSPPANVVTYHNGAEAWHGHKGNRGAFDHTHGHAHDLRELDGKHSHDDVRHLTSATHTNGDP